MTGTTIASTNERRAVTAYGRLALTVLLALYAIPLMRHPESGGFLDGIDLAIHETGHLVFGIFGEVIGVAGGTLFQLIVPATFVWYFAKRGDRHAATVPLWWVAQNLWNISVYVRDARVQELPLVGGGEHDWAYLLGRFGLLAHDQGIGRGVHASGTLFCIAAVASGIKLALEGQPTKDSTDRTAELMDRLLDRRRNEPIAQPMNGAVEESSTESFGIGTDRIVVRRLAGDGDARACAEIMASSEPWARLGRDYVASLQLVRDASREAYVATRVDGADVLGFVILTMQGAFVGYIQSIAVREEWRGRGLGSRLIAFAESRILREAPNVFICVSSFNSRARALYERLGYETVGELRDYIVRGQSEWLLRKSAGALGDWTTQRASLAFEPRRPAKD